MISSNPIGLSPEHVDLSCFRTWDDIYHFESWPGGGATSFNSIRQPPASDGAWRRWMYLFKRGQPVFAYFSRVRSFLTHRSMWKKLPALLSSLSGKGS